MKKIFITLSAILLLSSCYLNTADKTETKNKSDIEIKTNKTETTAIKIKEKKLSNYDKTIIEIENKISTLKNIKIDKSEIENINRNLGFLISETITKKALEKKDIKICDTLDEKDIMYCKQRVIIKIGKVETCTQLGEKVLVTNCKNQIILSNANKNQDTKICEQLVDDSENKREVSDCKTRILFDKAMKTLNIAFCKKITNKFEKEQCLNMLKDRKRMEKNMKEIQRDIK